MLFCTEVPQTKEAYALDKIISILFWTHMGSWQLLYHYWDQHWKNKDLCQRLAKPTKGVEKDHQNIFEIVTILKKKQATIEMSLSQLSAEAAYLHRSRNPSEIKWLTI